MQEKNSFKWVLCIKYVMQVEVLCKCFSLYECFFFSHRVVMMGDSGVGKTALVSQFMTSEYMHVYDASLGKSPGK